MAQQENPKQIKKTTTTNDDLWFQDFKEECSCNRGTVPIFYCQDETCKDKEQEIFCSDCVMLSLRHYHPKILIKDVNLEKLKDWEQLKAKFDKLSDVVQKNRKSIQPLIDYLDRENSRKSNLNIQSPKKRLEEDLNKFEQEAQNVNQLMISVEELFTEKEIRKIIQKIPELEKFRIFYDSVKYLEGLAKKEDQGQFLYDIYESTLEIAGDSCLPLINFDQENRDMLTLLKWKWLYSHQKQSEQNMIANVEEVKIEFSDPLLDDQSSQANQIQQNFQSIINDLQVKVDQVDQSLKTKVNLILKDFQLKLEQLDNSLKTNLNLSINKLQEKLDSVDLSLRIRVDEVSNNYESQIKELQRSLQESFSNDFKNLQTTKIDFLSNRLAELEQINSKENFLQSLKDIVAMNLQGRIPTLEDFKIKTDKQNLPQKFQTLSDLDNYARNTLKGEITRERNSYVTTEKNSLEAQLTQKINQKATIQEVRNQYDSKISSLEASIFKPSYLHSFNQSSILTNISQRNKVKSYFSELQRGFLTIQLFKFTRDGGNTNQFNDLVYNQGRTLALFQMSGNNQIFGCFTTKSWEASNDWSNQVDNHAFLFNLKQKYPVKEDKTAICYYKNGINFMTALWFNTTAGTQIAQKCTISATSDSNFGIQVVNGVQQLTGQTDGESLDFKEMEVYKIVYP